MVVTVLPSEASAKTNALLMDGMAAYAPLLGLDVQAYRPPIILLYDSGFGHRTAYHPRENTLRVAVVPNDSPEQPKKHGLHMGHAIKEVVLVSSIASAIRQAQEKGNVDFLNLLADRTIGVSNGKLADLEGASFGLDLRQGTVSQKDMQRVAGMAYEAMPARYRRFVLKALQEDGFAQDYENYRRRGRLGAGLAAACMSLWAAGEYAPLGETASKAIISSLFVFSGGAYAALSASDFSNARMAGYANELAKLEPNIRKFWFLAPKKGEKPEEWTQALYQAEALLAR